MPFYVQLYFLPSEFASLKMLFICYWVISFQAGIDAEKTINDNNLVYCKLPEALQDNMKLARNQRKQKQFVANRKMMLNVFFFPGPMIMIMICNL